MNPFPYVYLGCLAVVLTAETIAIIKGDKDANRTITANIKALISLPGPWWHRAARIGLIALLSWLPAHFGLVELG